MINGSNGMNRCKNTRPVVVTEVGFTRLILEVQYRRDIFTHKKEVSDTVPGDGWGGKESTGPSRKTDLSRGV